MANTTSPNVRGSRPGVFRTVASLARFMAGSAVFLVLVLATVTVGWFVSARRMFPFSRAIFRVMLRVSGVQVRAEGRGQIERGRGYVYVFNHSSFLDHFVLASRVPSFLVGVEKIESRKIPVYGFVTRWWGNVAIDRRDPEEAIRTIAGAQGVLADGVSICIAPEGTRSRDGRVGSFRRGGFHMAAAMEAPIVPVSIVGMNEVNPDGRLLLRGGVVRLIFHAPVVPAGEPVDLLATRIRDQICSVGLVRREARDEPEPAS